MDHDHTQHCPRCGGPLNWLGQLGRLLWLRCRDCGAQLSVDSDAFEE